MVRENAKDSLDSEDAVPHHLAGLTDEDINLAFQRCCVSAHPHRKKGGDLQNYFKVHLHMEVLKQWQDVIEHPSRSHTEMASAGSSGYSDAELTIAINKDPALVKEEAKAMAIEDLTALDVRLSCSVLQMQWLKEKLESEINHLQSHGAYDVIGVDPEVSDAELARAYKSQALLLHPDRQGGSTAAFQALQAAYAIILEQRSGVKKKQKEGPDESKPKTKPDSPKREHKASSSSAPAENGQVKEKKKKHENVKIDIEDDEESLGTKQKPSSDTTQAEEPLKEEEDKKDDEIENAGEDTRNQDAGATRQDSSTDGETNGDEKQGQKKDTNSDEKKDRRVNSAEEFLRSLDEDGDEHKDRETDSAEELQRELNSAEEFLRSLDKDLDNDSDQEEDLPENLEQTLIAAVSKIPAELVSNQAEMALNGAQMCSSVSRLCMKAAEVGSDTFPQLKRLAVHLLEIAQQVAAATGSVGSRAVDIPGAVMPLLDVVSKHSSGLKPSMAGQIVKGTKDLLATVEKVSGIGRDALMRRDALESHSSEIQKLLLNIVGIDSASDTTCTSLADILEKVTNIAREAADAAGAAALTMGEAQRHAENLVEIFGAAGLWDKGADSTEHDEEEKEQGDNESSSEDEKEPWEHHADWTRLLTKINGDVLMLQKQLRGLVTRNPGLIHAVSPPQKEALFSLVANPARCSGRCIKGMVH
eukprot:gnl/MRDRNA2_/MRDRNA2_107930_c0_seq1.p1 gnl/MRDRNA2_/MRDRNA2_107930_c0~~gnl/MRDRNA2_/MRDRNA2_107930_c0_seq1.p1  ORF type:complete len:813 (+),score=221.70 gnl/MRDRNA2_/MRDRNA2_107930_c0_seq1:340-2439(+)